MLEIHESDFLQPTQSLDLKNLQITGDQVLRQLSHQGKMGEWVEKTKRSLLIQATCKALTLEPSDTELQEAVDEFRRSHNLESAAKTTAWLEEQQMSLDDWVTGIEDQLLTQKLQIALFGARVDQHYLNHRHDYDRVALSQILVREESLADTLKAQLQENPNRFCQIALQYSLRRDRDQNGGFIGSRYLKSLSPEMVSAIQSSQVGQILGPFPIPAGFSLIKVETKYPTHLSETLRQTILDELLDQWIAQSLHP